MDDYDSMVGLQLALLVIFSVVMQIILINLLIGIMSSTYFQLNN